MRKMVASVLALALVFSTAALADPIIKDGTGEVQLEYGIKGGFTVTIPEGTAGKVTLETNESAEIGTVTINSSMLNYDQVVEVSVVGIAGSNFQMTSTSGADAINYTLSADQDAVKTSVGRGETFLMLKASEAKDNDGAGTTKTTKLTASFDKPTVAATWTDTLTFTVKSTGSEKSLPSA